MFAMLHLGQCLALIDLGLKFTLYVVREDRQEEPAGMRGVPKEPSPMERVNTMRTKPVRSIVP